MLPSSSNALERVAVGFATGSVTELVRQQAFGEEFDWGKVLIAGGVGAGIAAFVNFGGDSGLPVLSVLKPEQVGIASSIFAQSTSAVFVLDYADDLWHLLAEHEISWSKDGQL